MRRYFEHILKVESRRVQTIYILFTLTYLSRAAIYIVSHLKYKQINTTLPSVIEYPFLVVLTYYIGYNFWDVMSISLIMIYHYQNFLTAPDEDEASEKTEEISSYNSPSTVSSSSYGSTTDSSELTS